MKLTYPSVSIFSDVLYVKDLISGESQEQNSKFHQKAYITIEWNFILRNLNSRSHKNLLTS